MGLYLLKSENQKKKGNGLETSACSCKQRPAHDGRPAGYISNSSCSCSCWSLLYSAILRSRADSLRSHVILHEWLAFYSAFLNIHRSGVLTALASLEPHETAAVSARSVYTTQPCTMSLHADHIRKVHACLPVTCHLHCRMSGVFYVLLW